MNTMKEKTSERKIECNACGNLAKASEYDSKTEKLKDIIKPEVEQDFLFGYVEVRYIECRACGKKYFVEVMDDETKDMAQAFKELCEKNQEKVKRYNQNPTKAKEKKIERINVQMKLEAGELRKKQNKLLDRVRKYIPF